MTRVFEHLSVATMVGPGYGAVDDAVVAVDGERIAWVGPRDRLPAEYDGARVDGGGCWVTPGLVDCHTHLVYGGTRATEFEMRLEGKSYEDIARAGGGIASTVRATREASDDELYDSAAVRLRALLAEGVTTVEIKSGYGLDADTERRMLRVARRLGRECPVSVATTFLGAHALPPEFADADAYIDDVVQRQLPAVASEGLADAVDAFCEGIGFSPAQVERVFAAARAAGLSVKLHAEQLSNQGGAALAARNGALSADHLEYLDDEGVQALASAGTVAVLLPGAFYYLRETQRPPVEALRAAGVPMAIATDWNPGSSPLGSMRLMMNMACTLFGLTPAEALAGATVHGAAALGLGDRGAVAPGLRADLVFWPVSHPAELAYQVGSPRPERILVAGRERA